MAKKKITIEDLAMLVKKGFDEVDELAKKKKKGFDAVDERFDEMDARFEAVDERFDEMEARFNARFDKIESDVEYLKARVMEIGITLERHEELLEEHGKELRWLHQKIDEMTDPKSKKRMATYEEYTMLESRVATLEKKIAAGVK